MHEDMSIQEFHTRLESKAEGDELLAALQALAETGKRDDIASAYEHPGPGQMTWAWA